MERVDHRVVRGAAGPVVPSVINGSVESLKVGTPFCDVYDIGEANKTGRLRAGAPFGYLTGMAREMHE